MQKDSDLAVENARLRGDLLTISSRISHDLRTPLGGIAATAQLLHETLEENKLPVSFAQSILDSVDDMTRMIKQISFVTRATAKPMPKTTVNMKEIVNEALLRVESQVFKKNASIVRPDSWPQVNGVPSWLEEVWRNLLSNALKHSVGVPRIELKWHEQDGWYRFEVCDEGGGVPDDIRPGLFHAFDSLHELHGVRGLGLSIVQRLIALQGGKCGYEPAAGGSCFYFLLPST
jgi:signal transduction histidine kinase